MHARNHVMSMLSCVCRTCLHPAYVILQGNMEYWMEREYVGMEGTVCSRMVPSNGFGEEKASPCACPLGSTRSIELSHHEQGGAGGVHNDSLYLNISSKKYKKTKP